jgi:NitT/TauT family transport system substrate-binding protein
MLNVKRFPVLAAPTAALLSLWMASGAWAEAEYRPLPAQQEKGEPVHIRVYHQPYYTQSWSSSVMKVKQFWKKYLPPGSTVTYEIALQGALAVNAIVADKAEYGYGGDAPSVLGMTQDRAKSDIRGVWVNGYSNCCHCNVMIIAADAPYQKSPEDYVKWLQGKRAGGAKASCNDRWFRQVYKRFGVEPESHVHQSFEVTRTQFRVKRIDATGIWEPHASAIWLQDKTGRPAATGGAFGMDDLSSTFASNKFIKANPRAHVAMAKAEIESQMWLIDPKHEQELIEFMSKETEGYSKLVLWHSMYGKYPDEIGGQAIRDFHPVVYTDDVKRLFRDVSDFLWSIKVTSQQLPPDSFLEEPLAVAAKELGVKLPLDGGFITARPIEKSPYYDAKALEGVPPVVKK